MTKEKSVIDRLLQKSARKPKNKQHAAKGSAFIRFAGKLRDSASATSDPSKADWLHTVADAAAATGKEVRRLR